MEPRDSIPHPQELPIVIITNRINPVPHIDTYFYKINCNVVFLSMSRPC